MTGWIVSGLVLATFGLLVVGGAAIGSVPAGTVEGVVNDDRGRPVDEAVVSLASLGAPAPVQRVTQAIMDQYNKEFLPHVLPVYVGTPVSFPNRDNIRHHVYSFSSVKKFELPLYMGTPSAPVVFDKPGIVAMGCNIHDWMVGYIYVLSTPHFVKTGAEGTARLGDVPPGAYEARVWHPRMRGAPEKTAKTITVAAGEPERVAFVVSLRPDWRTPRVPGRNEGTGY